MIMADHVKYRLRYNYIRNENYSAAQLFPM